MEQKGLYNLVSGYYVKHFCEDTLNLDPVVQDEMCRNFYFKLWWPFCTGKRNQMWNFGRGRHEEHYCLEWTSLVQEEMLFKDMFSSPEPKGSR